MDSMKRQKDTALESEPPGQKVSSMLLGKSGGQLLSRKNEAAGPKWKWHSVMDMFGDESKTRCCREQYCIGTIVRKT